MLSDRCLSVDLSLCDVGVYIVAKNYGWMNQDETWHGGRAQLGPGHIVSDGTLPLYLVHNFWHVRYMLSPVRLSSVCRL